MTAQQLRAMYESGLWMIPPHCIAGLQRYMEEGIRPGEFLFALLRDGPSAQYPWLHADAINRVSRTEWNTFFARHMPQIAWGTELKVDAWMTMGGLHGMPGGK